MHAVTTHQAIFTIDTGETLVKTVTVDSRKPKESAIRVVHYDVEGKKVAGYGATNVPPAVKWLFNQTVSLRMYHKHELHCY